MPSEYALADAVSTKPIEAFLLAQPDVVDASVWQCNGQLMAHVTLIEGSSWCERTLKIACAEALGIHATPREWMLRGARLRAA